ncbi:MAG: hypothetical protein ACE5E9_14510 [Nitrospinaceae bacterium]
MDSKQIKNYCRKAQDIASENGIQAGLSFLIGEKFAWNFYELRKMQNKLKFLYPERDPFGKTPLSVGEQSLKLSYALTLSDNYREILEKIDLLKKKQKHFIREIKESFDSQDIEDYLDSYPRLAFKQKSMANEKGETEEEIRYLKEDVLSEAEDILIINELKKLFR